MEIYQVIANPEAGVEEVEGESSSQIESSTTPD